MTKGRLIYLMGPSGSGKDTLIANLVAHQGEAVYVPRRYITREVNEAQLEQHIYMTLEEFTEAQAEGLFSLHWQANGHHYALGHDVFEALKAGKMVLLNGSRAHFFSLSSDWKAVCVPVYLHVSASVQLQRLAKRGRENEAQMAARVARSQSLAQDIPEGAVVLDAEQEPQAVCQQFIAQIVSKVLAA